MRFGGIRPAVLSVGLAVLACVATLAACAPSGDAADAADADHAVDGEQGGFGSWRRLEIDGTPTGLSRAGPNDVIITGRASGGGPMITVLRDGRAHPATVLPGNGRAGAIDAISIGSEMVGVMQGKQLWFDDLYNGELSELRWDRDPGPADERGARPEWTTPLLDGEGDVRVIGAVPDAGGGWSLRAWAKVPGWSRMDDSAQLHVDRLPPSQPGLAPSSLLTGSTEAIVVVAGLIRGPGQHAKSVQSWAITDQYAYGDSPDTARWTRLHTETEPDAFTDIAFWDVGYWLAGHRDLEPVVYDVDIAQRQPGASLPMPRTTLDPKHPAVLLAGPFLDRAVMATQSPTGPLVWTRGKEPTDPWTSITAPPGQLQDAETRPDGSTCLLIDGEVWYQRLPGFSAQ